MTAPQPTLLSNYQPYPFTLESVEMRFVLHPTATRVQTKIIFVPNRENPAKELWLDGQELTLISASINGNALTADAINQTEDGLTISVPDGTFTWECETEINPSANTSLNGLFVSNGLYCTQCEAIGFRKITFYPDRPDVMTTFKVRIDSDQPIMLSNGNPIGGGDGWAEWHDPWPKPAYLFALVAGNLVAHCDQFETRSNRIVDLNIYVRPGDENKCAYAMDSLIRSMKWDEENYGREYDLNLFNIVAVDDFNMGAMENKGLNIFNSALVLASPETATDLDYERIEAVIAHEYFHNWTGNRITCRDWFQLCLKEGLTVFRDQEFTSDMRDPVVKRIADAQKLRRFQYREDAGPLAHPPRPSEYIEIDNFYTTTVYEKAAEIVGMLKTIVGAEKYRKALDLYFDRHDGQACTIEDWITVFEDVSGRDLKQFKLWYTSAGTPRVDVVEEWKDGAFTLHFSQSIPATPNEQNKAPRHIPLAIGLLDADGSTAKENFIFELKDSKQHIEFDKFKSRPTASILRGFSAPITLNHARDNQFLLAHDTDQFNKWEAGRSVALDIICDQIEGQQTINTDYLAAMHSLAIDENLDPAYRALLMALPSDDAIIAAVIARGATPDPLKIYNARQSLSRAIAAKLQADLPALYDSLAIAGAFSPNAEDAGKRALRNQFLKLISLIEPRIGTARAQFESASNMTDQMAALTALVSQGQAARELVKFHAQRRKDRLVIDKWFGVQAANTPPENAVVAVKKLTEHADFDWKNPNRFRSVFSSFTRLNLAGFHDPTGAGYELFANWIIRLDPVNAQTAAVASKAMDSWRSFDAARRDLMQAQLERILNTKNLSKNTTEIVTLILK